MHTIYSYGGGEYLFYIFNFVAMLVNKDGGGISTNIIRMVALVGVIWAIIVMYIRNSILPGATWLLWFMLASFIVVGPKDTIYIKDPIAYGGIVKHIDNVPLILVIGASSFSAIGHSLTETMESTFVVPGGAAYLKYIETGSLFGSKVIKRLREVKVEDPIFHANLDRFVQQCVVYDAMIGRKYTLRELRNTNDIWRLVTDNASPVLGFLYKDETHNEIVTCRAGVQLLNAKWNEATDMVAVKQGKSLFGMKRAGDPGYTAESAKTLFLSKFSQSYQLFTSIGENARKTLQQQMMIDVLREAPARKANQLGDSYALAKATLEQRSAYQIAGLMAEESLVVMRAVFEALIYGAFIFIYILVFAPGGYKILGYYFQVICWIQLWAPLYAILNFIMTLYGHYRSIPLLGEFGLSRANSVALIELHTDITALAGWLSLSVPYLSYMLINRGGVAAFVGLANSINSSISMPVTNAAAEKTTGNISLGNFSQGNINMQNMSAYKYNSNADFQAGQFTRNTETGAMKVNNQDNVVYLAGLGRTVSTFSTDVMDSKHLATQLMQQSQREKSILESQGKEYSNLTSSSQRDMADFINRLVNTETNTSGYSTDQRHGTGQSINKAIDFAKSLRKDYGLSESDAMQAAVGVGLPSNPIVSADVRYTSSTGKTLTQSDVQDIAKRYGYNETFDSVLHTARDLRFNDQQNNEKLRVDQISASYEKSQALRDSIASNMQNVERLSRNASIIEGSNYDVRTVMNQELLNLIANSSGVNKGSRVGYDTAASIMDATSGPLAERKQEFVQRFQEERVNKLVDYFRTHEIKNEAELTAAFNNMNKNIENDKPQKDFSSVQAKDNEVKFDNNVKDNLIHNFTKMQINNNKKISARNNNLHNTAREVQEKLRNNSDDIYEE